MSENEVKRGRGRPRLYDYAEIAAANAAAPDGTTQKDLAEQFGCSVATVRTALKA